MGYPSVWAGVVYFISRGLFGLCMVGVMAVCGARCVHVLVIWIFAMLLCCVLLYFVTFCVPSCSLAFLVPDCSHTRHLRSKSLSPVAVFYRLLLCTRRRRIRWHVLFHHTHSRARNISLVVYVHTCYRMLRARFNATQTPSIYMILDYLLRFCSRCFYVRVYVKRNKREKKRNENNFNSMCLWVFVLMVYVS